MNAQTSVTLSNLYHILKMREIIPDLGKDAQMTDENGNTINDASPLQVEEYSIKKRVGSSKWYDAMEDASPIMLQREAVYILAEMQRTAYLNDRLDERVLVAVSALVSQGIEMKKALEESSVGLDAGSTPQTPVAPNV